MNWLCEIQFYLAHDSPKLRIIYPRVDLLVFHQVTEKDGCSARIDPAVGGDDDRRSTSLGEGCSARIDPGLVLHLRSYKIFNTLEYKRLISLELDQVGIDVYPKSLKYLKLNKCSRLSNLPHHITHLTLYMCNIRKLPPNNLEYLNTFDNKLNFPGNYKIHIYYKMDLRDLYKNYKSNKLIECRNSATKKLGSKFDNQLSNIFKYNICNFCINNLSGPCYCLDDLNHTFYDIIPTIHEILNKTDGKGIGVFNIKKCSFTQDCYCGFSCEYSKILDTDIYNWIYRTYT